MAMTDKEGDETDGRVTISQYCTRLHQTRMYVPPSPPTPTHTHLLLPSSLISRMQLASVDVKQHERKKRRTPKMRDFGRWCADCEGNSSSLHARAVGWPGVRRVHAIVMNSARTRDALRPCCVKCLWLCTDTPSCTCRLNEDLGRGRRVQLALVLTCLCVCVCVRYIYIYI